MSGADTLTGCRRADGAAECRGTIGDVTGSGSADDGVVGSSEAIPLRSTRCPTDTGSAPGTASPGIGKRHPQSATAVSGGIAASGTFFRVQSETVGRFDYFGRRCGRAA